MKTVPISGTLQSVTFFEDDTIETVRQLVALAVGSHPDRLFIEVKSSLPKDFYATNPLHWTNLFLRLSLDGKRITAESLRTYINQVRPGAGILEKDITREQWEDHDEYLRPLFSPDIDFEEWRILGVEEVKSFALPLPPKDMLGLQAGSRPVPQLQSLFETLHSYEVTEIRATAVPDGVSPNVLLNYFPRLRQDTPPNIESLRSAIESAQNQLKALLDLDTPKHQTSSVVRIKWYIPLVSTRFTAPRTRFEQIFYGLTVSETTTPYVGFFTAKTETTRHKFYCKDTTAKKPVLDIPMWKSWTSNTMPQRRLPTLLLYRGKSRVTFDRIAVTDRDIIVDVRREKDSTETIDEMKQEILKWMESLDALVPFLTMSDVDLDRWQLSDLSVVATYSREIREFDMLRFPCLQKVFGFQNDMFRLLRAEHTSDDIRPEELQALQILNQEDSDKTPEYLSKEMGIPIAEASALFTSVMERSEELNLEKSLKAYPTIKFSPKEVIIKFVTDLDRTLKYVDILRHVLTSDADAVDAVCPKRMERVVANVAVPQQEIQIETAFAADDDFNALLGFGGEEVVPEEFAQGASNAAAEVVAPKGRKVKVASRAVGTYNYFNNRLQSFDPETFDKSIYPNKCDKPRQVVVLTPGDKARVGQPYDFSTVAENEKLEMEDPAGTAICPPYWCIRDEIPLMEEQLVTKEDGLPHCPVCDGKVRTSDTVDMAEFPVIKRDTAAKYPDYLKAEFASSINKRRIPCCFQTPRPTKEVLAPKEEATYVLAGDSANVGPLRFAYLDSEFATKIGLSPNYAKTVKKGRLASGESDVFRVGLGRPSKTLPTLLNDKTEIVRPRDAKDNVLQCSFFRSWKDRKEGDTEIDRIVSSIDAAYQRGGLSLLEELEYVTTFLKAEVIRVDTETGQVVCGFWAEAGGATSRTVVLLGNTLLASVSRTKATKGYVTSFQTDLRKAPFAEKTLGIVRERHSRACAMDVPVLADAVAELMAAGKSQYQVIMDPFQRIQAVFVPGELLLPVQPTSAKPDLGVTVRSGYADIRDEELPRAEILRPFLAATKNEMFRARGDVANVNGQIVELELVSGFRTPIQPFEGPADVKEVIQTVRSTGEEVLVDGKPNAEDLKVAQEVAYSSEIYEFLLFSLSKDIAADASGEALDATYRPLRNAIKERTTDLSAQLAKWFKNEAYEDNTQSPVEFVNKVRTPCGQYMNKDSCNKSSLCGWHRGDCKIRVKPIVEKSVVLRRIAKTLVSNDKQRALVLDGRMSPFFSTVLYLEMPHELITTTI